MSIFLLAPIAAIKSPVFVFIIYGNRNNYNSIDKIYVRKKVHSILYNIITDKYFGGIAFDRCKKSDNRIFIDNLFKYDVFNSDSITEGVYAESISDGLILSLSNLGKVDIEYISAVTGADCKTVITSLKGSVFQNPETWGECFYKGWETAEEYLSGNLMRKWQKATAANSEYCNTFSEVKIQIANGLISHVILL